ncbi:4Fe-4S binding protein [Bacteroides heparinolyticus]
MSHLTDEEGFRMSARERFVIGDACIKCGVCTKVCPRAIIELRTKASM